jgi:hypothetical protein
MIKTGVKTFTKTIEMDDATYWKESVEYAAKAFKLSEEEKAVLLQCKAAKLISEIPFLTREPGTALQLRRSSLSKLAVFIASWRCPKLANHQEEDTLSSRVSHFITGQALYPEMAVGIEKVLMMFSLSDHQKDLEADQEAGKYNPIASGEIDYEETKETILEEYHQLSRSVTDVLDGYMQEAIVLGGWVG